MGEGRKFAAPVGGTSMYTAEDEIDKISGKGKQIWGQWNNLPQ